MKTFLRLLDQNWLSLLILIVSDIFWFLASFLVSFYIRNNLIGSEIQPFSVYAKALPIVFLIVVVVFYFFGLYEQRRRTTEFHEIYTLTKATTFCLLLIMAGSFLQKYDYSRGLVLMFWITSVVCINFGRYLVRVVRRKLFKKNIGIMRVLIVGAGKPGRELKRKLEEYRDFGYRVVGFLDDKTNVKKSLTLLGGLGDLEKVIHAQRIDIVFFADPTVSHETIMQNIYHCEHLPVKFKVVSDLFEIIVGNISLDEIEDIPSVDLTKSRDNIFYRIAKRIFDIIASCIGLIVSAPFMCIFILLIRMESKGPAIFSQKRIGEHGMPFTLYKFRTMYVDAKSEEYAPTRAEDPRVTSMGRFLRKTSLDELPQLWNVLCGEMSMVGPRPEMAFIVRKYTEWQKKRLEVKPGITGLWQILGRKDIPLHENLEYDFYYIKNRSFLLDMVIIFKTILAVFGGKGAY